MIFPEYAQLNPLSHLNIVLLSLFSGAIKETILLACLFSKNTSSSFAVGNMSLIKLSIETSSTLENFFGLTGMLLDISSKISAPLILFAESLFENKILLTVISSNLANLLLNESI